MIKILFFILKKRQFFKELCNKSRNFFDKLLRTYYTMNIFDKRATLTMAWLLNASSSTPKSALFVTCSTMLFPYVLTNSSREEICFPVGWNSKVKQISHPIPLVEAGHCYARNLSVMRFKTSLYLWQRTNIFFIFRYWIPFFCNKSMQSGVTNILKKLQNEKTLTASLCLSTKSMPTSSNPSP